ncbi:MAG: hypothetical protein KBT11_05320 [Treponema sp.]|nr:hypothetical protein [Candidatus Treponema equifaecale]
MNNAKLMDIESKILFEDGREDLPVDIWNVYTSNHLFKEIYGKNVKNFGSFLKKKKIVKITSCDTKNSIYRFWNGMPSGAKSKDTLFLDEKAKFDLLAEGNSSANVTISKASKFSFFWNHYDHSVRISFKLAALSMAMGVVSLILGIISLF